MRLNEAIDLYLGTFDKQTTRIAYNKALKTLMEIVGTHRLVEEITPADLIRVHNELLSRRYAAATLRQRTTTLKSFFNWLVQMEMLENNPARVLKSKKLPAPRTREKAVTDDEVEMLLNIAQYTSRRDYALVMFLADTGARIGAVARLREREINWSKREATLINDKGDHTHQVKFGDATSRVLRQYLLWRKATKGDFVFSPNGGAILGSSLSQRINRLCIKLRSQGHQIRTISAHAFRHRKGHQLGDAHIPLPIISTALNHQSWQSTMNYLPDDWSSAADTLDDFSLKRGTFSSKKKSGNG